MTNPNHQFEATYQLGKELGARAERARILAIVNNLPAEFYHEDHVTRAVAKIVKEVQREESQGNQNLH